MRSKLVWSLFWALVAVFVFIVCIFTAPAFRDFFSGTVLFLTPLAVFFLLGVALIVFTRRERVGGKLGKFLLLTGAAASGFFLFVLLHNAFYALAVASSDIAVLNAFLDFLHAAFFFMAFPICPLGFLVGVVGTIVLSTRRLKTAA